jgi:hypothetical protein
MKCNRLLSLVKNWYLKVQEEAMAPARMVAFIEQHISQCEECLADPDVKEEAERIREIVLPPAKVPKPKVVRAPKEDVVEDEGTDHDKDVENEDVEDKDVEDENAEDEETEDDLDDKDDLEPDDIDDEDDLEPDDIDDDVI